MLTYEVNNRQRLNVYKNGGLTIVSHMDADTGNVYRADSFDDGDIVMALNLLRFMRDNGQKTVYLKYGNNQYEDFRIFQ